MPTPEQLIQGNFERAFAVGLLWILLWVLSSVLYRRNRGKVIFPRKPADAIFHEGTASGSSNRNIFTKMGGAQNCLMVSVTSDRLIVQPWFPFNLMFLPELYDLEYSIPRTHIRTVVEKRFLFWKYLEITFLTSEGGTHSISLLLRKKDEFLKSLGGIAGAV